MLFRSSDLDEDLIVSLKLQGAKIDIWGVGTKLITSDGCPSFGGVYKMAAESDNDGNFIPKIKLSNNLSKITNPGIKKILRFYDKQTGKIKADLICLEDEIYDETHRIKLFDHMAKWKKMILNPGEYTIRELLIPIFKNGECIYESPNVKQIQDFCQQDLNTFWDEHRRLNNPQLVPVDLSDKLMELKNKLIDELSESE